MTFTHVILKRGSWKNVIKMVGHLQKDIPEWRKKIPKGPLVFLLHESAVPALHYRPGVKTLLKKLQDTLKTHDAHVFFSTYELSLSGVSNTAYIVSGTKRKAWPKKAGTNADSEALRQIAVGMTENPTSLQEVKKEHEKLKEDWKKRSTSIQNTPFPSITLNDKEFEMRICGDIAVPPLTENRTISLVPALNLVQKFEKRFAPLRDAVIINDLKPRAYLKETGTQTLDLTDALTLRKVNLLLQKRGIKLHLNK